MRMLGLRASMATFRWDLIYLAAQLAADDRPGVSDLAPMASDRLVQLGQERAALEQAEDAVVIASALLNKKDRGRDGVLVEMGGVARALDKQVYATLFARQSPSVVAKLAVAEESVEVRRILGELAKLPADHMLRQEYEAELTASEAAVMAASAQSDEAVTALALQRSQLARFKLSTDQVRLEIHGRLVTILKDKAEADSFFRPTTASPSTEEPSAPEQPASPPPA